jgi:hypothetical protein
MKIYNVYFCDFKKNIDILLKRGGNHAFLIFQPKESNVFVQLRKLITAPGKYGIEISFPKVSWSETYYDRVASLCEERNVEYVQSRDGGVLFIHIPFGKDVTMAAQFTEDIFIKVFRFEKSTRFEIKFDNISALDELVDSSMKEQEILSRSFSRIVTKSNEITGIPFSFSIFVLIGVFSLMISLVCSFIFIFLEKGKYYKLNIIFNSFEMSIPGVDFFLFFWVIGSWLFLKIVSIFLIPTLSERYSKKKNRKINHPVVICAIISILILVEMAWSWVAIH